MRKVLVVDDDEGLLFILGEYLESCGFQFELANSPEKARNRLRDGNFDVVISDLEMPGESGLDLFRYISAKYPPMPFILITANPDSRIKRTALNMGVYAYMEKPFRLAELRRLINDSIQPCIGVQVSALAGLNKPWCLATSKEGLPA